MLKHNTFISLHGLPPLQAFAGANYNLSLRARVRSRVCAQTRCVGVAVCVCAWARAGWFPFNFRARNFWRTFTVTLLYVAVIPILLGKKFQNVALHRIKTEIEREGKGMELKEKSEMEVKLILSLIPFQFPQRVPSHWTVVRQLLYDNNGDQPMKPRKRVEASIPIRSSRIDQIQRLYSRIICRTPREYTLDAAPGNRARETYLKWKQPENNKQLYEWKVLWILHEENKKINEKVTLTAIT